MWSSRVTDDESAGSFPLDNERTETAVNKLYFALVQLRFGHELVERRQKIFDVCL